MSDEKITKDAVDKELNEKLCKAIPSIRDFHALFDRLLDDDAYMNGILVLGPAGMGKSYHVEAELLKSEKDYGIYNTHSTALGLYHLMYEHSGKDSVIVLDDIEAIAQDPHAISLLKAATFNTNQRREITWTSATAYLKKNGLPNRFEFQGKIVIIANNLRKKGDESFRAFLNRLSQCRLEMTPDEKKWVVRTVIMHRDVRGMSEVEKAEMLDFLEDAVTFGSIDAYNIRTAMKASDIWAYYGVDGRIFSKSLIHKMMEVNVPLEQFSIVETKGAKLPVEKRIELFTELTGYKRRMYFNIKQRFRPRDEHVREAITRAEGIVGDALKQTELESAN